MKKKIIVQLQHKTEATVWIWRNHPQRVAKDDMVEHAEKVDVGGEENRERVDEEDRVGLPN
jgi:hypothetical protein